ncbi:hypothetical protein B0H16DRAFT_1717463 [Mycena metata]|uniref:Uncharacterized protein n=1 Tax=Mycena metata TaxID=1033252 RepID=A0AAD7JK83_9AGAR|nr:hypothetical protein B0H16DRAFT_1717463 [Mycena metata]
MGTVWFEDDPPGDIAPVEAAISALSFTMMVVENESRGPSLRALGAVLDALTLPNLQELALTANSDADPLFWTQDHFHDFASRSSCGTTLLRLELHNVVITEEELVDTLSGLPALECLSVQDIPASTMGTLLPQLPTPNILITDNLLRRLMWTRRRLPELHGLTHSAGTRQQWQSILASGIATTKLALVPSGSPAGSLGAGRENTLVDTWRIRAKLMFMFSIPP